MNKSNIKALRMERQCLIRKADKDEYIALYRDFQPGQNVYWNGFGDPPSLTYRGGFNDIEFNRQRQKTRELIKGRFVGGNIGWIMSCDLELFISVFIKPLDKPTERQLVLMELIEREGALTIHQMKEETGMLTKEITPALHRLQEAFLIYEDQYDGEWDRGWHKFHDMFPNVGLARFTRQEALKILLQRFAFRNVDFDIKMAKSFYKLPEKEIKKAVESLIAENVLTETEYGFILNKDLNLLENYSESLPNSIYALHRNDFLVKSNEHWLKEQYIHSYPDTLYYLLIDGEFKGVVVGKFRYTPEVEDVILDISDEEANVRKNDILQAVHILCGDNVTIKRYQGERLE